MLGRRLARIIRRDSQMPSNFGIDVPMLFDARVTGRDRPARSFPSSAGCARVCV